MLWSRAQIVLRTAAAYGVDPSDPRRAAELLAILGAQPTLADAVAAVDAALAGPEDAPTGVDVAVLAMTGWRVAALTGPGRLATLPLRRFPGGALLGTLVLNSSDAERTARRANAFYRS